MAKDKTEKEKIKNQQREAWKKFKKLNFDSLTAEQRISVIRDLYETMTLRDAASIPNVVVGFDFWKHFENREEIKELKKFQKGVENTFNGIPKNPTPEVWLDKEKGIVPSLKRELKEKIEPFKKERFLKKEIEEIIRDFINKPENKDKEMSFNLDKEMKKALEDIDENVYKPIRAKIDEIESEIEKRTTP